MKGDINARGTKHTNASTQGTSSEDCEGQEACADIWPCTLSHSTHAVVERHCRPQSCALEKYIAWHGSGVLRPDPRAPTSSFRVFPLGFSLLLALRAVPSCSAAPRAQAQDKLCSYLREQRTERDRTGPGMQLAEDPVSHKLSVAVLMRFVHQEHSRS